MTQTTAVVGDHLPPGPGELQTGDALALVADTHAITGTSTSDTSALDPPPHRRAHGDMNPRDDGWHSDRNALAAPNTDTDRNRHVAQAPRVAHAHAATPSERATAAAKSGVGVIKILAGRLFDPVSASLLAYQAIRVDVQTGRVLDVSPYVLRRRDDNDDDQHANEDEKDEERGGAYHDDDGECDHGTEEVIDLSGMTVLPGFVDAHVHLFLHSYAETPWNVQLTQESLAERTIRATVHARRTLLAGFTTVRDLGTEGAADADMALRKCLSSTDRTPPMIPGPRYFCASRAIVPTGSYGPKGVHVDREGIDGITGAEVADGRDECVKAVRRQIGAGADWIKIYADYRVRSRMEGVSAETSRRSINTFDDEELKAMVESAHSYGVKVAVHATNGDTISKLVALGVDSIEHGYDVLSQSSADEGVEGADRQRHVLRTLARSKTTWVPTLAVYYMISGEPNGAKTWARAAEAFKAALEEGVDNMACGGDTGAFPHGLNALEMKLMVRLGADWKRVLRWATLGGWQCVRSMSWEGRQGAARLAKVEAEGTEGVAHVGDHEVPFGAIRRGWSADVIATCGDLEQDFEGAVSAENISFVMKAGRVYKRDGRAVEY